VFIIRKAQKKVEAHSGLKSIENFNRKQKYTSWKGIYHYEARAKDGL